MSATLSLALSAIVPVPTMVKYLESQGITPPADESKTPNLLVRIANVKSQAEMAALTINLTEGKISSDDLQKVLGAAFPNTKANGGNRHGSYFMSKARTGQLPGCNFKPAKEAASKKIAAATDDARVKELTDRVTQLEARIGAALTAKNLKEMKLILSGATTETPAVETPAEPVTETAIVPAAE